MDNPGWTPPPEFDDLMIIRPLGAGGMGSVFLARERHLDRLVAVKFVATGTRDPHATERFRIEARALARLQHPNIVAVYRLGEVDGHPYLAYEFVDGERIDRLRLPMGWPQVLAIMLGVARGLAAAHHAGVLHRDLKPANLMLAPGGDVKVLDFGLARIFDPATGLGEGVDLGEADPYVLAPLEHTATTWDASTSTPSGRLTSIGSLVGTPLYLAPELWSGERPTPWVDLYALGLIAYELLLGYHPRSLLVGVELAQQVRAHDLPRLTEEVPSAPRPLTELIDRLVARDPAERPASAEVVRDELEMLRALYRPYLGGALAEAADEVGRSFERLSRRGIAVTEEFFHRWFAADPSVVPVLADATASRPRMLLGALKLAVENLHDPAGMLATIEDLGRRHVGKGVRPEHFAPMGEALLATLAVFDPAWTEATRRAWTTAWNGVAQILRRTLEQVEPSAERPIEPWRWVLPPAPPRTRWAVRPGGDVAWQEVGHGPIDVVVMGEWLTDVDATWRHPLVAGFFLGLAVRHRVILFDRRGTGCSTRSVAPTLDAHVDDLRTVLDAAGADRPVLLALGDAAAAAALYAATRPRRVRALVVVGGGLADPGAAPPDLGDELRAGWGGAVRIGALAPSLAADPTYRHWWAALLRGASNPSDAATLLARAAAVDVSAVLPAVRAPTLVIRRSDDQVCSAAAARRLAERITGATLRELPGADHVPWAGDADAMLAALCEFVDDLPTDQNSTVAAAAVMAIADVDGAVSARARSLVGAEVARHGGVGFGPRPGLLAIKLFDRPARALACAHALVAAAIPLAIGLDVGPITAGRVLEGAAIERATALAQRAAPGQLFASTALCALLGDQATPLERCELDGERVCASPAPPGRAPTGGSAGPRSHSSAA
ncbi:MAG: alpha/beta fold hydrolase [Myxococcales bacterium]|nr:alpha/beta fold hydrolase [Myxococcales bacterium]